MHHDFKLNEGVCNFAKMQFCEMHSIRNYEFSIYCYTFCKYSLIIYRNEVSEFMSDDREKNRTSNYLSRKGTLRYVNN